MTLAYRTYSKNGHTYGMIVDNFRDPVTGKSRTTSIRRYGNLEKLKAVEPNYMERVARELEELKQDEARKLQLTYEQTLETLPPDSSEVAPECSMSYGEIIVRRCWEELQLHRLFNRIQTEKKPRFELEPSAYCLVAARLRAPTSKRQSFLDSRTSLFNYEGLKLEHLYAALDVLHKKKKRIVAHLNKHLAPRDLSGAIYDVTTFSYEELSKKKSTTTHTVLGLLLDAAGMPIDFDLFPNTELTLDTLLPQLTLQRERYGLTDLTLVGDTSLNHKETLARLTDLQQPFIIAQSIGLLPLSEKARIIRVPPEAWAVAPDGQWRCCELEFDDKLRLIVTFSAKRAARDRATFVRLYKQAEQLLTQDPEVIAASGAQCKAFITQDKVGYCLNPRVIGLRARLFGLAAFVTNKPSMPLEQQYRALSTLGPLEQYFGLMKTSLDAHPIFVRTTVHLSGHFVMCYLALVIMQQCLRKLRASYDPTFSPKRLTAFLTLPTFLKFESDKRSTQVLTKSVQRAKSDEDKRALLEQVDQILACFGIPKLHPHETAQSVYQKFGVSLHLNAFFTN